MLSGVAPLTAQTQSQLLAAISRVRNLHAPMSTAVRFDRQLTALAVQALVDDCLDSSRLEAPPPEFDIPECHGCHRSYGWRTPAGVIEYAKFFPVVVEMLASPRFVRVGAAKVLVSPQVYNWFIVLAERKPEVA